MDNKNEKQTQILWPAVVTRKQWLEESIEDHNHCVLCGTALTFKHKTDFVAQTVHEEAHCGSCGIRNRQSDYSLQ